MNITSKFAFWVLGMIVLFALQLPAYAEAPTPIDPGDKHYGLNVPTSPPIYIYTKTGMIVDESGKIQVIQFEGLDIDNSTGGKLYVHQPDGETLAIELYKNPYVTFNNDCINVLGGYLWMSYPIDSHMRFTMETPSSGVEEINASASVCFDGTTIEISSLKPGEAVEVYTLSGALAFRAVADASGFASVDVGQIAQRVLFVMTDRHCFKVSK